MQMRVLFPVVAWSLAAIPSWAAERPPLRHADRLAEIIHGLFPDKPRNVSFVEYFGRYADLDANLTMALEKLEFGVLDPETLDIAIKLAEDAHRLREMRDARETRRQLNKFSYKEMPYAWNIHRRNKLIQFMQHTCYSSRYEITKMKVIRQRYRNSTVYQMGLFYGNNLELKVTAGQIFSTMDQMSPSAALLWFVFHYNKLLNILVDLTNNAEYVFLLQGRLNDGAMHLQADLGNVPYVHALPINSDEGTNVDPENL